MSITQITIGKEATFIVDKPTKNNVKGVGIKLTQGEVTLEKINYDFKECNTDCISIIFTAEETSALVPGMASITGFNVVKKFLRKEENIVVDTDKVTVVTPPVKKATTNKTATTKKSTTKKTNTTKKTTTNKKTTTK